MSDGPSLSLQDLPPLPPGDIIPLSPEPPTIDPTTFMLWIELQPLSTVTGMLEIIGNALYRHGRFNEGNEIKHVAQMLREQHEASALSVAKKLRRMQPHPLETGYHGRVHDEDPTCHAVNLGDVSCQPVRE